MNECISLEQAALGGGGGVPGESRAALITGSAALRSLFLGTIPLLRHTRSGFTEVLTDH